MWTVDGRVETRMNNDVEDEDPHIRDFRRVVRARSHPQILVSDIECLGRKRR